MKIVQAMGPEPFTETEAIFIRTRQAFHDVSGTTWIPFLPKPGSYEHPKFGAVVIDLDRNKRMVESVKSQVYQEKVPLDLEHDLKVSGAVGWISDMRMNEDGSADAFVEWTDRGQEVLKGNRFRYISPEWFRQWKDPASGVEHQDVVAGGALTTRPFFKDKVLRALVASERGAEVVGREEFADGKFPFKKKSKADDAEDPQDEEDETEEMDDTLDEEEEDDDESFADDEEDDEEEFSEEQYVSEGFTEVQAAAIESYVEAQISAATQSFAEQLKVEKTRGDRAESALKVLETERRTERFTEMVRNRDAGAPWIGGADKQVRILNRLAETFGEDSEDFKDYVDAQTQAATQLKESQAFNEIGSSAVGFTGSAPTQRLEQLAMEVKKTNPSLTKEQAFSEVLNTPEGARLYAETLR